MQHLVRWGLFLRRIAFGAPLLEHSHQQFVRRGSMHAETYGSSFGQKFFCFCHWQIVALALYQSQLWDLRTWNQ